MSDTSKTLADIIDPLANHYEELRRDAAEARAKLASLDADVKRVAKVLKELAPDRLPATEQPTSIRPKIEPQQRRISPTKMERVRTWLNDFGDGDEVTQKMARDACSIDSGDASVCFNLLRDEGRVRLARHEGNLKIFKVINIDAEAAA